MKKSVILILGFTLAWLSSFSQQIPVNEPDYKKPKLFANLPDKINVSSDDLNSLFDTKIGFPATLSLSPDVTKNFEGELVSISARSTEGLQSLVIRSTNFNGARLTLSRQTHADRTVTYVGHIISFRHGDLFELQTQQGQLVLVKRNFYDLVNE